MHSHSGRECEVYFRWQRFEFKKVNRSKMPCAVLSAKFKPRTSLRKSSVIPFTSNPVRKSESKRRWRANAIVRKFAKNKIRLAKAGQSAGMVDGLDPI